MRDLAIYGAGGFGREVFLLIDQINQEKKQWNVIGFFDDSLSPASGLPIIGSGASLMKLKTSLQIVVAVADPFVRRSIVSRIQNTNISFPLIVHPKANRGAPTNIFGKGTIITEGAILTTGITFGEFVIVNLACTIGHDVLAGDFCSIMPGCNISGNVKIGDNSLIGTGAKILQNLNIGKNAKVGAGAVVTRNVDANQTVMGIPAKPAGHA